MVTAGKRARADTQVQTCGIAGARDARPWRRQPMSFANGLRTIVVAADLDGRSESAIAYARKLAQAYGSQIVLAHGLDPVEYAAVEEIGRASCRERG